ncbi:hypothetical protein NSPZN2_50045 [Nitrospira defluvii]|uniref:Uncharacterized protein n=1 Tax=Nitrospira defluvii TaxID=330214 RepID=A0ABN7M433_9BACT|nr:hypothetical protein NSPZN2_50045 [Nitrospira defluvii]
MLIPCSEDVVKVPTHHGHPLLFRFRMLSRDPDLNSAALVFGQPEATLLHDRLSHFS